jgi:hypothetical protein
MSERKNVFFPLLVVKENTGNIVHESTGKWGGAEREEVFLVE